MRVVVTGATGHVGSNLVRALLRRGDEVRVMVRGQQRSLEGLEVERVTGDVRDADSLRAAFAGAEIVYHLAAVISITGDPSGMVRAVNVDGTRRVAEAALAAGVRRLVHCSSVHAFDLYQAGRADGEAIVSASESASRTLRRRVMSSAALATIRCSHAPKAWSSRKRCSAR